MQFLDPACVQVDGVVFNYSELVAGFLHHRLAERGVLALEVGIQSDDVAWEHVAYGRTAPVSGIEASPPLFPRIDAAAPA